MKKLLILALIVVFISAAIPCWSEIPHLINYQGMLTDTGGIPLTDTLDITFRIYDQSSLGNMLWDETQNDVEIIDGLFNVKLGSVDPLELPFDEDYWLEIDVGPGEILTPRVQLTSVGYAFRSKMADTASYAIQAVSAETDSDWTISGNDMYSAVSGNVGIGTSNPTSPLTIQPVLGSDLEFTGGSWNADIIADRQFNVGTLNTSTFSLMTDNQYRLLIQGGGNVGIGTISPAAKLEVYYDNTDPNSATIAIDNGTGVPRQDVLDFKFGGVTEARIRKATNGDLYIGTEDNKGFKFQTNATNRMTIANTGEVGIGTESPDEKLHVNGNLKVTGKINGAIGVVAMGTYDNTTLREDLNVDSVMYVTNHYEIFLTGITYHYRNYITIVTPVGSNPYMVSTTSGSGKLLVYFQDKDGNAVQSNYFHFVVYDKE